MRCGDCSFWLKGELRQYPSETKFVPAAQKSGEGVCQADGPLKGKPTPMAFGCLSFFQMTSDDEQVQVVVNAKEAWQIWHMGPCPKCNSVGSSDDKGCDRCQGTGNVRYYDDGYVGEEQTREHPKEKELRLAKIRDEALARAQAEVDAAARAPAPVQAEKPVASV